MLLEVWLHDGIIFILSYTFALSQIFYITSKITKKIIFLSKDH